MPAETIKQLRGVLARLPEGANTAVIKGTKWQLPLSVRKTKTSPLEKPTFETARFWPGDPGSELIVRALRAKVPKLAATSGAFKFLLLEKDAVAGTVESQFEQLPHTAEVVSLLGAIDQIWSVNTVSLDTEGVIFTNQVMPMIWDHSNCCSLNIDTNEFWRVQR